MTLLREEEIERLFSVINGTRDRAILRLAYHAGLRASETGMLQLRDYDPKHLERRGGPHSHADGILRGYPNFRCGAALGLPVLTCGKVNEISGFSEVLAFVCRYCGQGASI